MKLYSLNNEYIGDYYGAVPKNFTGIIKDDIGTKYWFFLKKRHRLNGPAIEWPDGTKFWYAYGKRVTEEQCKLLHDIMKLKGLL